MSGTRILIVAGEASTDRIGARLVSELLRRRPDLEISGAGGPRMIAAGLRAIDDPTTYASVGIVEALSNARSYRRLWRLLVDHVQREKPDVFVPIDLPSFNLRLAPVARSAGAKVVFYVSPQVWAWKPGRVREIAALATKMLVLFRFEEAIYREAGVPVSCVGHPFVDEVPSAGVRSRTRAAMDLDDDEALLTLLPGSRRASIGRLLPRMLDAAAIVVRQYEARAARIAAGASERGAGLAGDRVRVAIGAAPGVSRAWLRAEAAARGIGVEIVEDGASSLLAATDLAIASSGTVTVEAALAATPMIVTYRLHPVSAFLARRVLTVRHVAMVNVLAGREVVPELLQEQCTGGRIAERALSLLNRAQLGAMRLDLERSRSLFGAPGATERAAAEILSVLR